MISCRDVAERASDHLDRGLPLRSRWEVRLHLFVCEDCRRYLDQLRALGPLLRAAVARGAAMEPAAEAELLAAVRARAASPAARRDGPDPC